ncbi:MAG: UvrD-helicase domain-containing protein [Chromatiales bacterium]|nr:UvrD-helicase domain-containing protein [Chromatiales bacterium]
MQNVRPPDADERERALDTARSFLVQAPAGAGKTELLVRRYLRLLAEAAEPEEILAVTFTRKAAAEMQRRIAGALADSRQGEVAGGPDVAPELGRLVAAVREQDAARGWNLSRHPARLRISTIDALNAALARSAPVSAGSSVLRPVAEQPERLYRLAARATLQLIAEPGRPGPAVASLLGHLDNDLAMAEKLLAQLLARRDQWLPFIGPGLDPARARLELEGSLSRLVERELDRVEALIPAPLLAEFTEVVHAAAINQQVDLGNGRQGPLAERASWWGHAAQMFLTARGEWRKAFNRNNGVPADQKDLKAHAMAVLGALVPVNGLQGALATVQTLPAPHYPANQWSALESLLTLLPFAAASLKLVFSAEGETDYAEVAVEARAALGEEAAPSELALRVDWRLKHLLLDEFQDTSQAQYSLLRALTRGWTPGDGRTLFLVGDPMQSIYRFRQAEVRLFLDVRDHGLPGIIMEFVRLRANFRSVPALVGWANDAFPRIFPPRDDLLSSAIAFAPSQPTRLPGAGDTVGVSLHCHPWDEPAAEAGGVVRVVKETLARSPDGNIGILVRSRGHAAHTVAALRAAGIEMAANDLVELGRTGLASDLLAITRALVHAGDRLAWLTVLRSPLCGLSLADLASLGSAPGPRTLLELAGDAGEVARLSADGRERTGRLVAAFDAGLARLGQLPLRDVVEGIWLELGGPGLAGRELPLADLILDEIGRHDAGGDCADVLALGRALDRTRASLPGAGARVQVMTIHKAKGLEFDTVIVPGLGRAVRREDRPALLWQELAGTGALDLLLAPVNASGADDDRLYELLWALRGQQDLAEADRLLYVAVTRARERLHLFGQVRAPGGSGGDSSASVGPARGSLLERLWPVVGAGWPAAPAAGGEVGPRPVPAADAAVDWPQPALRRLAAGWQRPPPPAGLCLARQASTADERNLLPYDWASAWTRQAGSVAHRWLQEIAQNGVENYTPECLDALRPRVRQLLLRAGVETAALDRAMERVSAVLRAAVNDEQGRWLLSSAHQDPLNEYAVTVADGGRFRHLVIDRAFVAADGARWVVDYKTGSHEGGDRETFIRTEVERYSPQLRAYRRAFSLLEDRPTKAALYFPLLQVLQIVDLDGPEPQAQHPG